MLRKKEREWGGEGIKSSLPGSFITFLYSSPISLVSLVDWRLILLESMSPALDQYTYKQGGTDSKRKIETKNHSDILSDLGSFSRKHLPANTTGIWLATFEGIFSSNWCGTESTVLVRRVTRVKYPSPREDSHIKLTGVIVGNHVLKRTPKRYQNLVLWVCLEFISPPPPNRCQF